MCVYDNVIFFCFDDNADNRDNFQKTQHAFSWWSVSVQVSFIYAVPVRVNYLQCILVEIVAFYFRI